MWREVKTAGISLSYLEAMNLRQMANMIRRT